MKHLEPIRACFHEELGLRTVDELVRLPRAVFAGDGQVREPS